MPLAGKVVDQPLRLSEFVVDLFVAVRVFLLAGRVQRGRDFRFLLRLVWDTRPPR